MRHPELTGALAMPPLSLNAALAALLLAPAALVAQVPQD